MPILLLVAGFMLDLSGMAPLYFKMYRRYGLYELFNPLVLFKFLNQHGKEAKPHMLRVILGIILASVSGMWLHR